MVGVISHGTHSSSVEWEISSYPSSRESDSESATLPHGSRPKTGPCVGSTRERLSELCRTYREAYLSPKT